MVIATTVRLLSFFFSLSLVKKGKNDITQILFMNKPSTSLSVMTNKVRTINAASITFTYKRRLLFFVPQRVLTIKANHKGS